MSTNPSKLALSDIAKSNGNDLSTPPKSHEVELTIFGPGFGECILVHLGSDRWIIVDSCQQGQSSKAVALEYLAYLGRDPGKCVNVVVATHWHDDHVRGLEDVVNSCSSALFACSSAVGSKEFNAMATAFSRQRMLSGSSGVKTISGVFNSLADEGRKARTAGASTTLLKIKGSELAHSKDVLITALSPSDAEKEISLMAIGAQLSSMAGQTQYRCPSERPNLMSVAIHVEVGALRILLGADLERHADVRRGWLAVLGDTTLPDERATAFKVSHHGAESGDEPRVWRERLHENPYAVMTPWILGSGRLPTDEDIRRIASNTNNGYITAPPSPPSISIAKPAVVAKQLKEMGVKIERRDPPMGCVRLRTSNLSDSTRWEVELFGPARAVS